MVCLGKTPGLRPPEVVRRRMEADGITPKKDKDGKMIPDKKDPLYDKNGKPTVPAGLMPRSTFDSQTQKLLENHVRIEEQKMRAQIMPRGLWS